MGTQYPLQMGPQSPPAGSVHSGGHSPVSGSQPACQHSITHSNPGGQGVFSSHSGRGAGTQCPSQPPMQSGKLGSQSQQLISQTNPSGQSASLWHSTASGTQRPSQKGGHSPVVLCSPPVRSAVRRMLEPSLPNVAVLGYNEIDSVQVESVAMVTN